MMAGRMNWLSRYAALCLAAVLVLGGCSEQPVDVRSEQDVTVGSDPDVVFDDILGFLDAYASRGLAASDDPTLEMLLPTDYTSLQKGLIATSMPASFAVTNWDYPQAGRSINCYVSGGIFNDPPLSADGYTWDLDFTFPDVHTGGHRVCCVLAENGVELDNCEATDCALVTVWDCCQYHWDCNDGNPLTGEVCLSDTQGGGCATGKSCAYGFVDNPGLCMSRFDCDCYDGTGYQNCNDDHFCVTCSEANEATDCNDWNDCTTDHCDESGAQPVCVNETTYTNGKKCCAATDDPTQVCGDSLFCTVDTCEDIDPVTGTGHCENLNVGGICCDYTHECDDGNPCTANVCIDNECRVGTVSDPLCCNPDDGDEGCDDSDICTHDYCDPDAFQCYHEDLTYLEMVEAGYTCCDAHPECQAGGLWEEEPSDNKATLDYCQDGQCVHVVDPSWCNCNEGQGCEYPCLDDGDVCTSDICDGVTNTCMHPSILNCCESDYDCWDGDQCTEDLCVAGFCANEGIDGCCNEDTDCDDGSPCSLDWCISFGCHYSKNNEEPDCCNVDLDCEDYNECTTNYCEAAVFQCVSSLSEDQPAGTCCFIDSQCNDDNPVTSDFCHLNHCYHQQKWCQPGDPCDDNQACTIDTCGPDLKCLNTWSSTCCSTDLECNLPPWMPAGDPEYDCLTGVCNQVTHACDFVPIDDCCQSADDCDDGDYCTAQLCLNKKCKFAPITNCCYLDEDCDDDNDCTFDECANSQCVNVPDYGLGGGGICCATPADCADGDVCTTEYCFNNVCSHASKENCCTTDSQCQDSSVCTCDICLYGACRHMPPDQALNFPQCTIPLLCCNSTADCDSDNNPCTEDECIANICTYTQLPTCTMELPYYQSFDNCNNVQAEQGWLLASGFKFVNTGLNTATVNWKCSVSGGLGDDKHQRFNWAPVVADFDSYLVWPSLDCDEEEFVTLMFAHEFDYYDDVDPMTEIYFGLYLMEESGDGTGPDALDTFHPIAADSYTADVAAGLVYVTIPSSTGWLTSDTYFAIHVGGETSYALNYYDIDEIRASTGRPPFFTDPEGSSATVAMRMDEQGTFDFAVEDPDDNEGTHLSFELLDAPAWVSIDTVDFNTITSGYVVELFADPGNDAAKLGTWDFTLRAHDNGGTETDSLYVDMEVILHVLVTDGYIIWAPEDEEGSYSETFANAILGAINANNRLGQIVTDITIFEDLTNIRGVFVTTGVQGLDYVLVDLPDEDGPAIDMLTDFIANGGGVYLEGGNTWGFDTATSLHSENLFPVTGTGAIPGNFFETHPPGETKGQHFCHGFDLPVSHSSSLAYALDTIQKIEGTGAIPILSVQSSGEDLAISYEHPTLGSRTIASTMPFAALEDGGRAPADLMALFIFFLEHGYPPCSTHEECFDSVLCTLDTCVDQHCEHELVPDCIPCADDLVCTASDPDKACALASGICASIPGVGYDSEDAAQAITWGVPVTSTITVPTGTMVAEAHVKLYITHTKRGDLQVDISHGGQTAQVKAKDPTDSAWHNYFTYDFGLDTGEMAVFNDTISAGLWTITVTDKANYANGTLLGWSVYLIFEDMECVWDGDCENNDACILHSCENIDPITMKGVCVWTQDPCDEGGACNTFEECDSDGVGCIYTPVECGDGNECTIDSCDEELGCVNELVQYCENTCDDHSECGYDDYCNNGTCAPIPFDTAYNSGTINMPLEDLTTNTSSMTLSDTSHYIDQIYVKVMLTHSKQGQLDIRVTNGDVEVWLKRALGSPYPNIYKVYGLADEPYVVDGLTSLHHFHPDGTWTLSVKDVTAGNVGTLLYWNIYVMEADLVSDSSFCDNEDMCVSDYCDSEICCPGAGTGKCCLEAVGCVNSTDDTFWADSACDDTDTCQGHRVEALCTNYECVSIDIEDDSGCVGELAAPCTDCRPNPVCTAAENQDDPEARCPLTCGNDDAVCESQCYCDGTVASEDGTCVDKLDVGDSCIEETDCKDGLHCENGVCCNDGEICCSDWSECPNSIGVVSPLDSYFTAPECGATPATCQGTREDKVCEGSQCGYALVDDDTDCGIDIVHSYCGFYPTVYCDATLDQDPACATSCTADTECDANAHCTDGACIADYDDGHVCDEGDGLGDNECVNDHCQNGFCCGAGDCCVEAEHCVGLGYSADPWCVDPDTCQGARKDETCVDFMCLASAPIEDDTACDQLKDCAPYVYDLCDGSLEQPMAECPTLCLVDADCVEGAHCQVGADGDKHCYYALLDCEPCEGDWNCVSGNCNGPAGSKACCAAGSDCALGDETALCPASYSLDPVCDDEANCQGYRIDATSTACVCDSVTVEDDSGCTTAVSATAIECECYITPVCDGTEIQNPVCPESCVSDAACSGECVCDVYSNCTLKFSNGEPCLEDNNCKSGYCSPEMVCCDLACDSTCEACNLTWPTGTVAIDGDYDGADDFDNVAHRLGTGDAGVYVLATWDDEYLYVAWEGVDTSSDNVYIAIDTDPDPWPDSGAFEAFGGLTFNTSERKPEVGIKVHGSDAITYQTEDGLGGWNVGQDVCADPISCWSHSAGNAGDLTTELRIPLSALPGIDPVSGFAVWMWANNNAENLLWSIWPATANNTVGAGVQNATDAQFLNTGAGQCTNLGENTDADAECDGVCQVCDGLGACSDALAGSDPDDDCDTAAADTCGFTGQCGEVGCEFWGTEIPCAAAICVNDGNGDLTDIQQPSFCTGTGSCQSPGTIACFPHMCDNALCKDPCAVNVDCVGDLTPGPGYYCNNRALNGAITDDCELKLEDGSYCDEDSDCQNSNCVEIGSVGQGTDVGVCCTTACTGHCNTCITGACVAYVDFTDPDADCGGCAVCDGAGFCRMVDPDNDPNGDPKFFCDQESTYVDTPPGGPLDPPVPCNLSGQCDGLGSCAKWSDGEICRNSQCNHCKIEDLPDYCDELGNCFYQGPGDPCTGGLGCANTIECRTTCGSDTHCCGGAETQLCMAAGSCTACDNSSVCPTDGVTPCCLADTCDDVKGIPLEIDTITYLTSTAGAVSAFTHNGLGVNSPDRVFSFTTGDVSLEFTASVAGTNTAGGAVNTLLYLHQGDCLNYQFVAINDNCGGDPTAGSCLNLNLKANTTYFLVIDGNGSPTDEGDMTLSVTFDYYCGNDSCDPGEVCGGCADCSPCCGDASCDILAGENSCTCDTDCQSAVAGHNACGDNCCSEWDCSNQCGDDCDMCDDCTFCYAPVGELESVTQLAGDLYTVTGWACDEDHLTEALSIEVSDDFGGDVTLEGTFTTGQPTATPNPCGENAGFTGTITISEEGAHTLTAFAENADVNEPGAALDGAICVGICGAKICGDDGCAGSCGSCVPACKDNQDDTFSAKSTACTVGQCADYVDCATEYACDGALSKADGDACATSCENDDDDYCAPGYTCDAGACVPTLDNGLGCDEDADCLSNNCRKEISSAAFYCAAADRECSDQGGDGYDAGGVENPWICTAVDVSVECAADTLCDTWFSRFCDSGNLWTFGSGIFYTCSADEFCADGVRYANKRCDGAAGAAGACTVPGDTTLGCSDLTILGALHCVGADWTTVGPTACCNDLGEGVGQASDPCSDKHPECVGGRTCGGAEDTCQMVADGTTCDVSGYCVSTDPDWCATGKGNGEECAGDYECASKHCDPDLAGVKRCHATETSCVQDHTGAETVTGAGFCVTGTGFRTCSNAAWGATVNECVGCESCTTGACQDDNTKCVQTAWDGCDGGCTKTRSNSGQCLSGVCGTSSQLVAVGNICDDGDEILPSAAGYCDATVTCTLGDCSGAMYYRGCDAAGTGCAHPTPMISAGQWNAPFGSAISTTGTSAKAAIGDLECQTTPAFECDDTDHCSGDDQFGGYTCDGTGACKVDVGVIGCCTHAACGATEYCAADNVCTSLSFCAKQNPAGLGMVWKSASEEATECTTSGWDDCDGTCTKTMSNTGFCSGTGPTCGTDSATVEAGYVCSGGSQVDPSVNGIYCDMSVTCTTGSCAAQTHYRGCSATGNGCVDVGKIDGPIWNAPAGEVIAESIYKLGTTCETDATALCQVSNHCSNELFYAGFSCNGSGVCSQDAQVSGCCKSTACATSEYCPLTTHTCTDLPDCAKQVGDNGYTFQLATEDLWNDCANDGAWDGCLGFCMKTKSNSGLCSGTSFSCGTSTGFVSNGTVCDGGAEVAPSQAIQCTGSVDCVAGACSAERFYLGCKGTDANTCELVAGKTPSTAWFAPDGTVIDKDDYKIGASCSTAADFCLLEDHCSGVMWYEGFACDGVGACLADMGDQGCCDHADCGPTTFCNEADHQCVGLATCAMRSDTAYGYQLQPAGEDDLDQCDWSGWDGCESSCVKTASNSGSCSGTDYACATSSTNVELNGKVCAGPGLEVNPSLAIHCDVAIDCVDNACAADTWFRGCAAGTTDCTDTGHTAASIWYATSGQVIDETAANTGANLGDVSCSTDTSSCDDVDHCNGDDWFDGHTCNGTGACGASAGDLGCCNHTDCNTGAPAGQEAKYCNEADHTCTLLPLCTERSATAYGYILQGDDEDLRSECADSGWDGCDGTCKKTKSNSGFCSGDGQACGTTTGWLEGLGKVCAFGAEEDPTETVNCDTTIDCVENGCTASTYFRGCSTHSTTCVDDNRQAGTVFQAPIGTVVDETTYKVATTCTTGSTGYCAVQGHCVGDKWLIGYLCDGGGGCNISAGYGGCCENTECNDVQKYCDIDTHTCKDLPLCTQQTATWGWEPQADGEDLWDECDIGTWDTCVGHCVKRATGGDSCDGSGKCYPYEYSYLVAGKVCDAGQEVAPSGVNNCTTSYDCIANHCSANRYWLGCQAGTTNCEPQIGKVAATEDWPSDPNEVVTVTEYRVGSSCQTAVDYCDETGHCSGDDWFLGYSCDGVGACSGDMTDGGCCNHSDCGLTQYCAEGNHQCTALPPCTMRTSDAYGFQVQPAGGDQQDDCEVGTWSCNSTCERFLSNTGDCSGTSQACATLAVPVDAGKVCGDGNEVDPSAAYSCDAVIDCVSGSCSASRYFRGCDAAGTGCAHAAPMIAAATWYASAGVVINETAINSEATVAALSCATADVFCATTDHCSGNDWFDGFSCDGLGDCAKDKDDVGCCNHTDCAGTFYCDAGTHACVALPTCAKRSLTAYGYDWQTASQDLRDECTASGWDGCNGACAKTKSNTGDCSGVDASCGTDEEFLSAAGKVCVGGVETDPTVAVNCDTSIHCVDNTCTAATYYRGCQLGGAACTAVNQQDGPTWFAANATVINGTIIKTGTSCAVNTDACAVGSCVGVNYFDGFACNGAGACNVPQNDVGCCSSDDCPLASTYCNIDTHACEDLPLCTQRSTAQVFGHEPQPIGADIWDDCNPDGFNSCQSICVRQATGGDYCDGNGECEPFEYAYVTDGNVCVGGDEIPVSASAFCDQVLTCANGACSAARTYRGCATGTSACTDNGSVAGADWHAGVNSVISVTENKIGGSCQTSAAHFCDGTDHCVGKDRYAGWSCDGGGACDVPKTDVGCCLDSDCGVGEHCDMEFYLCDDLETPLNPVVTAVVSVDPVTGIPLNSEMGQVVVTWTGELPAGYEYHLQEVTPSGDVVYTTTVLVASYTSPAQNDYADNVLYCYRVRAQDTESDHYSDWSDTICAFTPDRTPTFEAEATHTPVVAANRIDSEFTANDLGLVVYMPFEEATGSTTVDRVSGAAQAISGAAWTSGQAGAALEFDGGNNDMVEMPDTGKMANFTLSAWVYNGSGGDGRHSMVRNYWEIYGNKVCMYSADFVPTAWRCSPEGSVPLNEWSNIATTWDGSKVRHYVDGELVFTESNASSGTSMNLYQVAGYSGRKMKGKLDELRIYNRALGQREIRDDMMGGVIKTNLYRSNAVNGDYVAKYSALSCTELGWGGSYGSATVCGESDVPGCYTGKNWAQANAICEADGGRLCTWAELNANEAQGTGCGYDNARVWTSTPCGSNSYWSQAGKTGSLGTFPKACTSAASTAAVRCCGDATPFESTSSIADTESWDWNAPNTPNAPAVAVLSDTEVQVQWAAPADTGATYYYYTKTFDDEGNESNYIQHASFEDGVDYSNGSSGTYSFVNSDAHSGAYSLYSTSAFEYELHPGAALFVPGGTYRLSAWVKESAAAAACNQYLHARWYFASGTPVTTAGGDVANDGAWHQTSVTITLPSNKGAITDMAWYLGYDTNCVGARWIDDIEIVRITSSSITTGIKDFEVQETTGAGGGNNYGWGTALNYTDSGLTGSTEYCYKARARDNGGNIGAWSGQTCATTDPSCEPLTTVAGLADGGASLQVCGGASVTLSASASGGFCTGAVQYAWYVGATQKKGWSTSSSYTTTVSANTTFQVRARCNDCATPLVTDDVAVTLYECCDDPDCSVGKYCSNHVCTTCTTAQCTLENCQNGTAGCCDADSDCNPALYQYCDDGIADGTGPNLCEAATSLPRGTSTGSSQIEAAAVKDIGWYANFSSIADACVIYDVYNASDTQFDIKANFTPAYDGDGNGAGWYNYRWFDLSTKLGSTGNKVLEFDAAALGQSYRNVMLGFIKDEVGHTDGSNSWSCCPSVNHCVDDYALNSTNGCTAPNGWKNTGGGSGTEAEQCRGGQWYTPDGDSTTCSNAGKTWFSSGVTAGSPGPCCGDDGGADDFYYQSGNPASAKTLVCERCLNGSYTAGTTVYGNGYASGTTCYYGVSTCNASSAANGATCTMTNSSAKCLAATTAAAGCGTHGIWTGAVNTDWFNTGNWSDYVVPLSTTAVTIPNVTNDPVIAGTAVAKYIVINSGGHLTLSSGKLTVNGSHPDYGPESIRNYGTLTASGGTLQLKGILNRNGKSYFSGATVNFSSHMYNVNGYTANEFNISAGTVNAQSIPNYEGKIVMTGGTLNNSGYYREYDGGGGQFQGKGGTVNFKGSSYIRLMKTGSYFATVIVSGNRYLHSNNTKPFVVTLDLTISGTLSATGKAMELRGDFINNGAFNHGNNTVTFGGNGVRQIRGSSPDAFYNLVITGTNNSSNWVQTGTGNNTGFDLDIDNNLTVSSGYLEINDKSSGITYVDVGGSVTIASGARFDVNDSNQWIYVRTTGNWNKEGSYSSGSYSRNTFPGSGTVTINGTTSFNQLVLDVPGKQVNFEANHTTTVKSLFRVQGTAASKVILRSTIDGTPWKLKSNGTDDVDYCDVKNSDASGGSTIDARIGGVDQGGNTNWLFPIQNGHPCPGDAQCISGNCDADWYGTLRCHATATKCVNDSSGAETANTGYWKCAVTGTTTEGASTKVCNSSTWTTQNCTTGEYCSSSTAQCTDCTTGVCATYLSCRDGGGGVCCDQDSECGASKICVNEDNSSMSNAINNCGHTYTCRAVETVSMGAVNSKNYSAGAWAGSFDKANCGDHAYWVPSGGGNDVCIRYAVYNDNSNSNTLVLTQSHDSSPTYTHSPAAGTGWKYNYIHDITNSTSKFIQFDIREWDTGFGKVMFGYKRTETGGGKDSSGSTGCCNQSTDCVDDSVQGSTGATGCYNSGICKDTGSSASSQHGGYEYCSAGTWHQQDDSKAACDTCNNWTCVSEANGGSDYGTSTTKYISTGAGNGSKECCGDDTGEYIRYRMGFPTDGAHTTLPGDGVFGWIEDYNNGQTVDLRDMYYINFANSTADAACCSSATDCVGNGKCVAAGSSGFTVSGPDQYARCVSDGTSAEWRDLDGNQSWCQAAGFNWALPQGNPGGEYHVGDVYNKLNGGIFGSAHECCGDDAGEVYSGGYCH